MQKKITRKSTYTYLIFVIFFTQAKFLENKIYTEKRQFLPIFRVTSEKFYTGQKKFTRPPPMGPLTNMRYVSRESFWNHGIKKWSDITSPFILNDIIICFIAFFDVFSTKKVVTQKTHKIQDSWTPTPLLRLSPKNEFFMASPSQQLFNILYTRV